MRTSGTLRNIRAIAKRELLGYFSSPVAYVFLVIFLLLIGFFTFNISRFFEVGQADLRSFFEWHPWIFLFLVPAVTMRLWAEERRLGTIELILTFPVTVGQAILGKFIAAWLFIAIGLLLTFPIVLTTLYLGSPDLGTVICGYVGSLLLAGAYLGIGAMTSALTRSQVIAFVLAVSISLFFVLAGYPPVTDALSGWAPLKLINLVSELSFLTHYAAIGRGVLDIRDVVYFLSLTGFMLMLNAVVLLNRRSA